MTTLSLLLPGFLIAAVAAQYATIVIYQRREARQRRLFTVTLEFARKLGFYESNTFLMLAQTGDQIELERRWPTWAKFRDAAVSDDYAWGIA